MIDAIESPACSTPPQFRASKATPARITPHTTVASRARFSHMDSSAAFRRR